MSVAENSVYYLEIVTPDVESVCDFYSKTHGWVFQPMDPVLGNARVADLPGGTRCGVRAPMHDAEKPTVRTYVRVNDMQLAFDKAVKTGANVLLEPMELPGHGTIAIVENGGAEQGLWQLP